MLNIILRLFNLKKYNIFNYLVSTKPNEYVHVIKKRKYLIFFGSTEHSYFGYYHTKRICDKLNKL